MLASQIGRCPKNGLYRPEIASFAAEHARECFAHFGLAGIGIRVEQPLGSQYHGRGRIARLYGSGFNECALYGIQLPHTGVQTLNGFDAMAGCLTGKHGIGAYQPPVQQYRGRARFTAMASETYADIARAAQDVAKRICIARGDFDILAINVE